MFCKVSFMAFAVLAVLLSCNAVSGLSFGSRRNAQEAMPMLQSGIDSDDHVQLSFQMDRDQNEDAPNQQQEQQQQQSSGVSGLWQRTSDKLSEFGTVVNQAGQEGSQYFHKAISGIAGDEAQPKNFNFEIRKSFVRQQPHGQDTEFEMNIRKNLNRNHNQKHQQQQWQDDWQLLTKTIVSSQEDAEEQQGQRIPDGLRSTVQQHVKYPSMYDQATHQLKIKSNPKFRHSQYSQESHEQDIVSHSGHSSHQPQHDDMSRDMLTIQVQQHPDVDTVSGQQVVENQTRPRNQKEVVDNNNDEMINRIYRH